MGPGCLGVKVEVRGDKLRLYHAKRISPELWPSIREHKHQIINHLAGGTASRMKGDVIPWMLEEWRRQSIPEWRRIYRESVAGDNKSRANYALWMLVEVLKADVEEVGRQAKDENKKP